MRKREAGLSMTCMQDPFWAFIRLQNGPLLSDATRTHNKDFTSSVFIGLSLDHMCASAMYEY